MKFWKATVTVVCKLLGIKTPLQVLEENKKVFDALAKKELWFCSDLRDGLVWWEAQTNNE